MALNSKTYETPINPSEIGKFMKLKEAKKQEMADSHNEKVNAGKAKTKSEYKVEYTIADLFSKDKYSYAKMTTSLGGKNYESYWACANDTNFFMRNIGEQKVEHPALGFTGYSVLGTQILPRRIKVGDTMLPYFDNTYTTKNESIEVKKQTTYINGPHRHTGKPVHVGKFLAVSESHTIAIHYAKSMVTAEMDFPFNGKTYKAYKIESESWTKTTQKANFSGDSDVDELLDFKKMQERISKKFEKIEDKKISKLPITNELGYMVTPRTEWYVPELGVVNLVQEFYGFIAGETVLESID